jgi:signal transduction histidine kinase
MLREADLYERRAIAGVAAAALLTAGLIALSVGAEREQRRADGLVSHTRDVLETGLRLAADYQDVPLHSERYALTKDRRELARIENAQARLEKELAQLRALTADNPEQERRIEELRRVTRDGFAYNARLRSAPDAAALRAGIRGRENKPLDEVRRLTTEVLAQEQRLLIERRARLDRSYRVIRAAFLAACLLALGGLTAGLLLLAADARRRRDSLRDTEASNERLRARGAELARSNEELERFAFAASHDLKEPLRMVVSYTQLLERRYKGKLDAQADEFIGYAVDGAKRMADLIDGLLEFSRAGRDAPRAELVDLDLCLDAALRNLRAALQEAGARVERGPLPRVLGSRAELSRVLQNLVGNALKFRAERAAVVRVSAERRGPEWVIAVADNGIGLAPDDAGKVFRLFTRLHTKTRYPGTGLGLAICKKLVESRGGRIWIVGRPGEGSTVFFTARAA